MSAGIGFWTRVDWVFFAPLSEYYTSLESVIIFLNTLYMRKLGRAGIGYCSFGKKKVLLQ
jgi:hypothetical protein